ncbi:MAG: ABC transporter ATP-binding protein [Clostridia bacterium]|nr:ABC transporter ATP-binding protein [Clostridia bacterium]
MLEAERLCAGYGGAERVHDVTLSLPKGKLTAIVGPNGSGKSTLLKALAGLIRPMSGRVTLGGRDAAKISPRERAKLLSFLPQFRPAPEMTVSQLVAHGRYPHMGVRRALTQADKTIVEEAMARAGADAFAGTLVTQLSGGERQRAYMAMLLAQDAPVALLDEPAASLDPCAQFECMALLRQLAREGRAVALVSHDLPLAMQLCDELLVMEGGRLRAAFSPRAADAAAVLEEVFHIRLIPAGHGAYALGACATGYAMGMKGES